MLELAIWRDAMTLLLFMGLYALCLDWLSTVG